ncbi:MAG TPA: hypothetical protein VFS50_15755 [Meiothermus sp.]|nr:hypothetical protein [Meiothermus sp.]
MSLWFEPLELRSVTLKIVMSPMCQYSCEKHDGQVNDWHLLHYSTRAVGAKTIVQQGRFSVSGSSPTGLIRQRGLCKPGAPVRPGIPQGSPPSPAPRVRAIARIAIYPLVAPAVSPLMNCSDKSRYRMISGNAASVSPAKSGP